MWTSTRAGGPDRSRRRARPRAAAAATGGAVAQGRRPGRRNQKISQPNRATEATSPTNATRLPTAPMMITPAFCWWTLPASVLARVPGWPGRVVARARAAMRPSGWRVAAQVERQPVDNRKDVFRDKGQTRGNPGTQRHGPTSPAATPAGDRAAGLPNGRHPPSTSFAVWRRHATDAPGQPHCRACGTPRGDRQVRRSSAGLAGPRRQQDGHGRPCPGAGVADRVRLVGGVQHQPGEPPSGLRHRSLRCLRAGPLRARHRGVPGARLPPRPGPPDPRRAGPGGPLAGRRAGVRPPARR